MATTNDKDDEELRRIRAAQESSNRMIVALVALYGVLIVMTAIFGFYAMRRINHLESSTVTKITKNFGELSEAARKSELLPRIMKAGTDLITSALRNEIRPPPAADVAPISTTKKSQPRSKQ